MLTHEEKDFLERYDNGAILDEHDIKSLCWGEIGTEIERIDVCEHRWVKEVEVIVKIGKRYFSASYNQGLTEYQENDYSCGEITEVVPKMRIVEVIDWIPIIK